MTSCKLVRSNPERAVRVRALAGTLCCVLGQDILLSQMGTSEFNAGGNPAMD